MMKQTSWLAAQKAWEQGYAMAACVPPNLSPKHFTSSYPFCIPCAAAGSRYTVLPDGSLHVSGVGHQDRGLYECRVSNPAGRQTREIRVKGQTWLALRLSCQCMSTVAVHQWKGVCATPLLSDSMQCVFIPAVAKITFPSAENSTPTEGLCVCEAASFPCSPQQVWE